MVHLSNVRWSWSCLLVAILILWSQLILLPRTMISIMPNFSIAIAHIRVAGWTILHRSVIGIPLAWRLATNLLLRALVAILLLVLRPLLIRVAISLIRWSLVPLLRALLWVGMLAGVASRGLSLKPLPFGIHLPVLIVNHNSAIHQCLEVGVGVRHELELETII